MTSIPPLKRCSKCGVDKPHSDFHKDKSRRDGYRDLCKACVRKYQSKWLPTYVGQVQLQRSQVAVPATKQCTVCKEEKPSSEFHKTPNTIDGLRVVCKPCACDYQHSHRHDPRYADKVRDSDRRKYHDQPEHIKKQKNRQMHEHHQRKYWNDPDFRAHERIRSSTKSNRRRLKKSGNGGSHTMQEWIDLCAKYNHICLCCGKKKKLTRDHIVPVECGGKDDISNIQPLCRSCNSAKGIKTIDYRPVEGDI